MGNFNLRNFSNRVLLSALLSLGMLFLFDIFIAQSHSDVTSYHVEVSTTNPVLVEKAVREYREKHYNANQIVQHSKNYRFGKLVSETWRYMDGREVTQGIGEQTFTLFEVAAPFLVFAIVYCSIPMFQRRPSQQTIS
ncbi:MAG TPA: hypothetical protein PLN21_06805 [Gemmatales bacterium]|nr:hypothetical protein [Gemmatales bacterium]